MENLLGILILHAQIDGGVLPVQLHGVSGELPGAVYKIRMHLEHVRLLAFRDDDPAALSHALAESAVGGGRDHSFGHRPLIHIWIVSHGDLVREQVLCAPGRQAYLRCMGCASCDVHIQPAGTRTSVFLYAA